MPRFSTFGLAAAVAAFGLSVAVGTISPAAAAPTYTVLYTFTGGADGNAPQGALLQDLKGNLIGETMTGGTLGLGNIYSVSADGSVFNSIYSFGAGIDGQVPLGGLRNLFGDAQIFGNDFGVTQTDGNTGNGTIFTSDLAGHETVLHNFQGPTDGSSPSGRLLFWPAQNNWWGTAASGGSVNEAGVVFRINPNGSGFAVRHVFKGTDGAGPFDGLQYGGDGNFYGVTTGGGSFGEGVLYRITPGGNFKVIHNFTGGADGGIPEGVLGSDLNGNLYGVTNAGGLNGLGTIFRVLVSGQHFTTLYNFTGGADGGNPGASVTLVGAGGGDDSQSLFTAGGRSAFARQVSGLTLLSGGSPSGTLFGTTTTGGAGGGSVWSFNLNTNTFNVLYDFTGGLDGGMPLGKLLVSFDGNIYGTTNAGGGANAGVVFKISGGLSGHSVRRQFQGYRTIH
jgi:uncharacterized repeat protein (TIGR03803 family)